MAEIHIITEQEKDAGWIFTLRLGRGTADSLHTLILSWVDCEHWTHGSVPPSRVAEAIAQVALAAAADAELPECFDAGRLSRQIDRFSEKLTKAISAG